MRVSGATYREICDQLDVSIERSRALVLSALREQARLRDGSEPTESDFETIRRERPKWMRRP